MKKELNELEISHRGIRARGTLGVIFGFIVAVVALIMATPNSALAVLY